MNHSDDDIDIPDGVESVRRRPVDFLGEATVAALVARVLRKLLDDYVPPTRLRILVWGEQVLTIAFDGVPLPVALDSRGVSQLYDLFLEISMHNRPPRVFGGGILNAFSERLVVCTIHGDVRYRAAFARGGLTSFLEPETIRERFATNWFTFRPDATVLGGTVDHAAVKAIVSRIDTEIPIEVTDRSSERAYWG